MIPSPKLKLATWQGTDIQKGSYKQPLKSQPIKELQKVKDNQECDDDYKLKPKMKHKKKKNTKQKKKLEKIKKKKVNTLNAQVSQQNFSKKSLTKTYTFKLKNAKSKNKDNDPVTLFHARSQIWNRDRFLNRLAMTSRQENKLKITPKSKVKKNKKS